ncbi:30S ribosomal protein S21 [Fodinibius sediminis]|nr:30S ribosomal protein S21 [Fodinibius sediminis]
MAFQNEEELKLYHMVGVKVKDNESIDRAVNRFKKLVARSRILNEYKDRQQYTKPSKERREALKKSIREQRRRQRHQY